jgi:RNA polymerase primary sigma factor
MTDKENLESATSSSAGDDSLVIEYLKSIAHFEPLNRAEEINLAIRIEAGLFAEEKMLQEKSLSKKDQNELSRIMQDGKSAKDLFFQANLYLVAEIAERYQERGLPFLELIQEGSLGLMRAVEKFDYTKDYTFAPYATWWIRSVIMLALADQDRIIRIPDQMIKTINKLVRTQVKMLENLGREATTDELSKELKMKPEKVLEIKNHGLQVMSLQVLAKMMMPDTML